MGISGPVEGIAKEASLLWNLPSAVLTSIRTQTKEATCFSTDQQSQEAKAADIVATTKRRTRWLRSTH